ncbi:hypothetical protein [Nocardioides piscis]|uniref:Uncharacterized protein n=1 Tax=Nocardioides piscis TaxID=2714938 RepID=A0A6G7YC41_9ACTN|nr:hypothetical protein [Nocardioides piscis]QIK74330.1 hypothetical protein G7071_01610 [Nocardioides piscis]
MGTSTVAATSHVSKARGSSTATEMIQGAPMSARPAHTARGRHFRLLAGTASTLVLIAAAGCGTETDPGSATDPSPATPSQTETQDDPSAKVGADEADGGTLSVGDSVTPGQAHVVSASNVKTERPLNASALPDDEAAEAYLADLDPRLAEAVRPAIEDVEVPSDHTLFASLVSVGCDEPTQITWTRTFEGITANGKLPVKGVQCLVPVTSLALFLVPGQ